VDKSALLAARLPSEEVEIPGVGTVTLRGLSRYELHLAGKGTEDPALVERRMISYAMVDPQLSVDDVEQWQKVSPAGELGPVTEKLRELSGLAEGAAKSGVAGPGEEPDAGV